MRGSWSAFTVVERQLPTDLWSYAGPLWESDALGAPNSGSWAAYTVCEGQLPTDIWSCPGLGGTTRSESEPFDCYFFSSAVAIRAHVGPITIRVVTIVSAAV